MALIKCPECGRENVSDTAESCPECGYNIKKHFENPNKISAEQDIYTINNTVSIKENKKKVTKYIIIFISIILIAILLIIAFIVPKNNSLSKEEKYMTDVVSKYRLSLKDPDSLKLRSDVLMVEYYYDEEKNSNYVDEENQYACYCFFVASAKNGYGASTQSTIAYKDKMYIGDVTEQLDEEDFDSLDDYKDYLKARAAYFEIYACLEMGWSLSCDNFNIADCKDVGEYLKIDYIEDYDYNEVFDALLKNK